MLAAGGVGWLFILSAMGGFGGDTGRGAWWALTILPYPIGWGPELVCLGRSLRAGGGEGEDRQTQG